MISPKVAKLLTEQIGHELRAHQTYMGISLHFERQSLDGWAGWFKRQAVEEAGHATKVMTFLIDNEVAFDLPPVGKSPTTFPSAADAVRTALDNELKVSTQFDRIAATAQSEGDTRSFQFVQWFIEEQVEEERTVRRLLDLVESGINLFQAESMLEQEA
jgi:ferritin